MSVVLGDRCMGSSFSFSSSLRTTCSIPVGREHKRSKAQGHQLAECVAQGKCLNENLFRKAIALTHLRLVTECFVLRKVQTVCKHLLAGLSECENKSFVVTCT